MFKLYLTIGLLFFSLLTVAQKPLEILNSGDSVKTVTIPPEQIPIVSVETTVQLDRLAESLISEDRIAEEKNRNDSILAMIDSLLILEKSFSYDSLVSRSLINKKKFWIDYQEILKKQGNRIRGIVEDLYAKSNQLNHDLQLWTNTRIVFDSIHSDTLISHSIDEVIRKADSIKNIFSVKNNAIISLFRRIAQYNVRIDNLISGIDTLIQQRQEEILTKTQPAIIELNLADPSLWNPEEHIRFYIDENIQILKHFYQNNTTRILVYLFYLISLIVLFHFLMKKSKKIISGSNNVYQHSTISILRRPLGVAIILGIFSSGLFFPNRPPILVDLSILILIIPILDIVAQITNNKGKKYMIIFTLLILLRFINYVFPPETHIHRLILLVTGILEIIFLISLLRYMNISQIMNQTFSHYLRLIIILHLFASVTGLVSTITGYLRLAEIAIDLSITNTLVGLLLIISSVTLIGLIQFAIDGKYLRNLKFLQNRKNFLKKRVSFIVLFFAAIFWIDYILQILRVNNTFYQFIGSVFNAEITIGSASFTFGNVLLFFFIIWLSVIISGMIRAIVEDDVFNRVSLKKGVPRMISVVLRFTLISVGVFLAVSALGMPLNQLTIIFSAFGVGIGFGLQNIVNNFVSGVVLLFERPVQIGDTVQIGNLIGTVKTMGIRSSNVRTFDGAEVVVPNANLISNEVINWTLSDKKRRIEIISGVAYGSDVHKVQKILLKVLNEHPDVLKKPDPLVLFNEMGESSLDFRLLFWTENFDNWIIIKSEVIFKIHDVLKKAGITVPFPQRDLHIKWSDIPKNEISDNFNTLNRGEETGPDIKKE